MLVDQPRDVDTWYTMLVDQPRDVDTWYTMLVDQPRDVDTWYTMLVDHPRDVDTVVDHPVNIFLRLAKSEQTSNKPLYKTQVGPCVPQTCPEDQYSFSILSGAANVLAPKICVKNKLVLAAAKDNAGPGLNIVVINGKTGDVVKTGHFNMYDGEVKPLVEFLQTIEKGFAVLIASYDEPATKLNDEVKKMIGELGSTAIQSMGFRDSWVFVGGKGSVSHFEKHIKNEGAKNTYDGWPEMIDMEGCIPQYLV
ncbi:protein FAM3C-like [Diretmus argenteus]